MATRVCPTCGSQYVASVRRCIDCDVMLVDDTTADGETTAVTATPLGEGDQIAYELEGWGNQLRVTLAGMLDLASIPFVWEAGTLVVPALSEEQVDECIAAVEGGETEELNDDEPLVAFEIEGLTPDELAELDAQLIAEHVPHAWDEDGELLVPEASEAAVGEIIQAVLDGHDDEDDDGLDTHAALDALFVAVDKLVKDPSDQKLVARYRAAVDGITGRGVPYGLAGRAWDALQAQAAALLGRLDGDGSVPDEVDEVESGEPDDAEAGEPEAGGSEDAGDEPVDQTGDEAADGSEDVDGDAAEEAPATARDLAIELRDKLRELV